MIFTTILPCAIPFISACYDLQKNVDNVVSFHCSTIPSPERIYTYNLLEKNLTSQAIDLQPHISLDEICLGHSKLI